MPLRAVSRHRCVGPVRPRARLASCAWVRAENDAAGTGFVVDVEKKLLVTCRHVVADRTKVDVIFPWVRDGELVTDRRRISPSAFASANSACSSPAKVLRKSDELDLALVELESLPAGVEGGRRSPRTRRASASHSASSATDSTSIPCGTSPPGRFARPAGSRTATSGAARNSPRTRTVLIGSVADRGGRQRRAGVRFARRGGRHGRGAAAAVPARGGGDLRAGDPRVRRPARTAREGEARAARARGGAAPRDGVGSPDRDRRSPRRRVDRERSRAHDREGASAGRSRRDRAPNPRRRQVGRGARRVSRSARRCTSRDTGEAERFSPATPTAISRSSGSIRPSRSCAPLRLADRRSAPGDAVHTMNHPGGLEFAWVYAAGTVRQRGRVALVRGRRRSRWRCCVCQLPAQAGSPGGAVLNDAANSSGSSRRRSRPRWSATRSRPRRSRAFLDVALHGPPGANARRGSAPGSRRSPVTSSPAQRAGSRHGPMNTVDAGQLADADRDRDCRDRARPGLRPGAPLPAQLLLANDRAG